MSKPSPHPPGEQIVYGIVCTVTLAALPNGLREPLQDQQEALCQTAATNRTSLNIAVGSDRALIQAITASFDDLVRAFRAEPTFQAAHVPQTEKSPRAIVAAATLIQLVTRAAMPLREGNVARSGDKPHLDSSWTEPIAAYRVRLQYEARVSPGRFHRVEHIDRAVRAVMRRGRRASRQIVELDDATKVSDKSQNHRGQLIQTESRNRLASILEDRIEDGAWLAARLIGTAWSGTGNPTMTTGIKPAASAASEDGYVASRNSKVFHRIDCPHAKRIKATNRVTFSTLEQAQAAHKKPCHTCKPG